jgi:hypothetical protein
MAELQVAEDGRYSGGDVPFGYILWGDRRVDALMLSVYRRYGPI